MNVSLVPGRRGCVSPEFTRDTSSRINPAHCGLPAQNQYRANTLRLPSR